MIKVTRGSMDRAPQWGCGCGVTNHLVAELDHYTALSCMECGNRYSDFEYEAPEPKGDGTMSEEQEKYFTNPCDAADYAAAETCLSAGPADEAGRIKGISKTRWRIRDECKQIAEALIEKNRKYGDSAINPVRIFSKADPAEQINVRLDDKISRIMSGQADEDEDVEFDLIGYLILKRVQRRMSE